VSAGAVTLAASAEAEDVMVAVGVAMLVPFIFPEAISALRLAGTGQCPS